MTRVVVTGMGLCTSLDPGIDSNWQRLCDVIPAKAGIHHRRHSGGSRNPTSMMDPPLTTAGDDSRASGFLRARELAKKATSEALQEAGLWGGETLQGVDPSRVGCTVSASKPLITPSPQPSPLSRERALTWLIACSPLHTLRHYDSADAPTPQWREGRGAGGEGDCSVVAPDVINQFVRRRFGLRGESRNVIAACATGAYSIALGASWIEQGLCDVVLAGSVEPYPHPLIAAGFRQMGVMSAEDVMRPFDKNRSGFVFGEGAGTVILESEENAKRRGHQACAVLSGWALGSDAHRAASYSSKDAVQHLQPASQGRCSAVAFNSGGQHIAGIIRQALRRGPLAPEDIGHVNAHGTATRLNDWIETRALLQAFGRHAKRLKISATKGSTGHLLGAAGSVEFIFTVLALRHQFVPPTATLENADPDCPLDYTPGRGHSATFEHAMSLSFGFGGPIGALVVSRA